MRRIYLITLAILAMLVFAPQAQANNIKVSDVSLQNLDSTVGTVDIKFDVSWDNSFTRTDSNGNAYFDRAWVFVKYQIGGTGAWYHATLVSGASLGSYSTSTAIGITFDGKGAFCKAGPSQTLRWNYGTTGDNVSSSSSVQVKVMAIEMVYIPQGSFVLGSGGTETSAFYAYPTTTNPYTVGSEDAITVGTTAGNLYYPSSTYGGDQTGPVPAAFPKGYGGFYVMKYEVSQGQYRDFLNTLTYAQQVTRTANAPNSAAGTGALINPTAYRNAIKIKTAGVSGTTPAVYGCDLNGNGTYDESDDGEWIACNYLSWADLMAYADWAGLRPMTELEFEKASRGPASVSGSPTANEYAWGNTTIDYFSDLSNAGTSSEVIGPTRPNANCNYSSATPDGPVRCGMFATSSSSRTTAGASYYGIMELSGNLWERCVTIGNSTGRAFTGLHGNGTLDSSGNADVTNWPGTGATGSGCRGGDWDVGFSSVRVSDRPYAAYTGSGRYITYGGRFARTP